MEQKTIGKFLSALRKANGYTQQQVADMLCVSNKTISKWECDDGYPEITMLPAIAELYGVTVDEILNGERTEKVKPENVARKSEERTRLLIERSRLKFNNLIAVAVPFGLVAVVLAFLSMGSEYSIYTWIGRALSLVFITVSVIIAIIAFNNYKSALKMTDIDTELLKKYKNKGSFWLSVELFLTLAVIISNTLNIIFNGGFGTAWTVIGSPLLVIIAMVCYNKLKGTPAPEIKHLRKRFVILTSLIMAMIFIVSFAFSFKLFSNTYLKANYFSFYEVDTCAPNHEDYQKFKNYVVNGEPLYIKISENVGEDSEGVHCVFYQFLNKAVLGDNGYYFTQGDLTSGTVIGIGNNAIASIVKKTFATQEEADAFTKQYILEEESDMMWVFDVQGIYFLDDECGFTYYNETVDWKTSFIDSTTVVYSCIAYALTIVFSYVAYFIIREKYEKKSV